MPHPAANAVSIITAAAALGLEVQGRRARCINSAAHQGGDDAHPSLSFFPESNRFQCFSCGSKGDVVDLVRAVKQCDFKAAIEWMRSLVGGQPLVWKTKAAPTLRQARTPDKQATEVYTDLFQNTYELWPDVPAGQFLCRRGLNLEIVNKHRTTHIDDPQEIWDLLIGKFGLDRLRSAGLVSHAGKFLFARHRLLFFYFFKGSPVYVQARDFDGRSGCKELSLAGLHSPVPYNADLLCTPQECVCLCEGCIDTLSALQMGLPAIGVPGVLGFRNEWFDYFQHVGHVVLLFDADDAGRRQAAELRAQFRIRKIKADAYHPDGVKDMNDLLQKSGGLHE